MFDLKVMLKNKCEENRSLATKLSEIAGYQNPTGFYKFLNNKKSEFKDFNKLLKLVKTASPEKEFEVMDSYIRSLKPNNMLARQSLEYANLNKLDKLFTYLIDELSECTNVDSKEWAKVYKLDWEASQGLIAPFKTRELINELNVNTVEMMAFCYIAKYYTLSDDGFNEEMNKLFPVIMDSINQIPDGFIKDSYFSRLYSIAVDVKLHKGLIDEAEDCGLKALKHANSHSILSVAYLQLGNLKLLTSYDMANEYLNKCFDLSFKHSNEKRLKTVKRNLNFLDNFWGKEPKYLDLNSEEFEDKHEVAFYYIRKNEIEKALDILNSIEIDLLNDYSKGFHFYYRGLATNKVEYFFKSVEHFNKIGEKYYKKVSIIEMEKLGVPDYIINMSLA